MVTPENAVARHALAVYDELEKRAVPNEQGDLVFTGNITEVFNYFGISTSMYSRVRKVLIESRSVEVLQRGSGNQPSIMVLHGEPPIESLSDPRLTLPRTLARLIREMDERVSKLEARIPLDVLQALREHEDRLNKLEELASERSKEE